MDKNVLNELEKPLKTKSRRGLGGKIFNYIPSEDIVNRMNKVFNGSWNAEIKNSEIIEDQVLISVKVSVWDSEAKQIFVQEGYASHPITRYSEGKNNGKIIDVGNSYRSAMSKAIKTACSRWGVGLFIDTSNEENNEENSTNYFTEPYEKNSFEKSKKPEPNFVDSSSGEKFPDGEPPIFGFDNNVEIVKSNSNGSKSNINFPDNTTVEVGMDDENSDIENLTSVQELAILNLCEQTNKSFKELAKQALNIKGDFNRDVKTLSYSEAVEVIKTGNNLLRNK
jgi:hypothetical protein